jgi:hypothetical protein
MTTFQKAKQAQLGEVHEWHGVKMVKTANGWEPVDKAKKKKKPKLIDEITTFLEKSALNEVELFYKFIRAFGQYQK